MNSKAKFLSTLDWSDFELTWHGDAGMVDLGDERLAKVELARGVVADRYKGLFVTIIHKDNGTVDTQTFSFDGHLDQKSRADKRDDYQQGFHIWDGRGKHEFYIATPKTTKPLCEAVEAYIALYA